jgi:Na+-translocating ferredoxin:NAD+ oxidoreductase subunit G
VFVCAAAALLTAADARAQSAPRLTQDEALRLAFPAPAAIERRTAFLTDAELAHAVALAGTDARPTSAVVTYYVARAGDAVLGAAYFDAHRVRSLREVLMVVVGPDARVRRVEVVRFDEPPDYLAPASWLRQFEGRALDDELSLSGAIATMSGATLTARATVRATRRALALHAVIGPFGDPR